MKCGMRKVWPAAIFFGISGRLELATTLKFVGNLVELDGILRDGFLRVFYVRLCSNKGLNEPFSSFSV